MRPKCLLSQADLSGATPLVSGAATPRSVLPPTEEVPSSRVATFTLSRREDEEVPVPTEEVPTEIVDREVPLPTSPATSCASEPGAEEIYLSIYIYSSFTKLFDGIYRRIKQVGQLSAPSPTL